MGRIKELLTGRGVRIPLAQMAKGMHFAADPDINQQILSRIYEAQTVSAIAGWNSIFLR